mgnify:FL=1|jgi:hypothetical protein
MSELVVSVCSDAELRQNATSIARRRRKRLFRVVVIARALSEQSSPIERAFTTSYRTGTRAPRGASTGISPIPSRVNLWFRR